MHSHISTAELETEIRYLSTLPGRSLSAPENPPPANHRARLAAFTHLSYLLCLGVPAVAVTGSIENETVSVVVVATQSGVDDHPSRAVRRLLPSSLNVCWTQFLTTNLEISSKS
jgi:hypothetical protein